MCSSQNSEYCIEDFLTGIIIKGLEKSSASKEKEVSKDQNQSDEEN